MKNKLTRRSSRIAQEVSDKNKLTHFASGYAQEVSVKNKLTRRPSRIAQEVSAKNKLTHFTHRFAQDGKKTAPPGAVLLQFNQCDTMGAAGAFPDFTRALLQSSLTYRKPYASAASTMLLHSAIQAPTCP
ncbi:hypothetical protein COHCIP112018_04951 [Cohnella sp. JJ-181]|nr:hypothetical protein COHCIP112018_04951 [Cohnella sp. JJ-181]